MNRLPPNELWRIAAWIKQEQFDVIHTHMSRAHFFGVLLRKLTGVPCVATAHTTHFQLHWRFNDLVLANSESTRDFQIRYNGVPSNRLLTIPFSIDMEKFSDTSASVREQVRCELGISDDRPLIGMIGQVTERKGQRELIAALPELIRRMPNLKVVFIGQFEKKSKYYRQLRSSLYQKQLFRRVIWAGRRNNVHELIQGLDVCVVPSLKEPLGLCALEAMAAGVPVAAARVGGLQEIVLAGKTGLLFDPRKPNEIADSIERILSDRPLRDTVIAHSRQMLDQQFSPAAITTRIESALQSVVRPKIKTAIAS